MIQLILAVQAIMIYVYNIPTIIQNFDVKKPFEFQKFLQMLGVIVDEDKHNANNQNFPFAWIFDDYIKIIHLVIASTMIPLCSILRLSVEIYIENPTKKEKDDYGNQKGDRKITEIQLPNDPRFTNLMS